MSTQDKTDTIRDLIDDHFDAWDGGFLGWTWDARDETLADLQSADYDGLAYEIGYSVREHVRSIDQTNDGFQPSIEEIEPVAAEWLKDHRDEMIDDIQI